MSSLPSSEILDLLHLGGQTQELLDEFGHLCTPLGGEVTLAFTNAKVELESLINELHFELGKAYAAEQA